MSHYQKSRRLLKLNTDFWVDELQALNVIVVTEDDVFLHAAFVSVLEASLSLKKKWYTRSELAEASLRTYLTRKGITLTPQEMRALGRVLGDHKCLRNVSTVKVGGLL